MSSPQSNDIQELEQEVVKRKAQALAEKAVAFQADYEALCKTHGVHFVGKPIIINGIIEVEFRIAPL
jgi:hypothetical protein